MNSLCFAFGMLFIVGAIIVGVSIAFQAILMVLKLAGWILQFLGEATRAIGGLIVQAGEWLEVPADKFYAVAEEEYAKRHRPNTPSEN